MRTRRLVGIVAVSFLALWLAAPVGAGGWAVVTMDALPVTLTAGQEHTIGFTVRQHGQTPVSRFTPSTITFRSAGGRFIVQAPDAGPQGHYVAQVTFPSEGTWQWDVNTFGGDHPMPPLTVVAAGGSATAAPERPAWLFVAIPVLAACAVASLLLGGRGRRMPTLALR